MARAALGNVLQLLGDLVVAEAEYRRSLAMDRGHAGVWDNLAFALLQRGAIADAAACLDEALADEPSFADALRAYARLAPRYPELGLARAVLHRVLRAAPAHALALEIVGSARLKRDLDATGAADAFERAIRAGGDGTDLYCNMGIALEDLGRIPEALAAMNRALASSRTTRSTVGIDRSLCCSPVASRRDGPTTSSGSSRRTSRNDTWRCHDGTARRCPTARF